MEVLVDKEKVEFDSQLPGDFRKLSIVFAVIALIIVLIHIFGTIKFEWFGALNIIALMFVFIAYTFYSVKAKLIIFPNECRVEYKVLKFTFKTTDSLAGFKSIRACYRAMENSGAPFFKKFIQLDFSKGFEDNFQYGDVQLAGHVVYEFNESPAVVADTLLKIQQVTKFKVVLGGGLKELVEPELDKLGGCYNL
jgi:hypothetical protein